VARKEGPRDVDRGLQVDVPLVPYTSNKETKSFIEREASKIQPGFQRASGNVICSTPGEKNKLPRAARSLIATVTSRTALNADRRGPLQVEHGVYINFISDHMAENKGASHSDAVRAWHEVKVMDAPKTYAAWVRGRSA
jgi:hypothetical protein